MKKIVSFLLVLVIIISVFSVFAVNAADSDFSIINSKTVTYGSNGFNLSLNVDSVMVNDNISYSTKDSKVATVKNGKVNISGCGKTVVSVKTKVYNPNYFENHRTYINAKKSVTLIVKPGKVKFKVRKDLKRKAVDLILTKQKNCDKYLIHISSDKKFKKNNRGENTYSGKISKITLKPPKGKKFFARIKAYKKIDGKMIPGKWSKAMPYGI